MSEAVLFSEVTKSFVRSDGSVHAVLSEISFYAAAGEVTCILGPSGCGKTTLLRLACGLHKAESGRIIIDGADSGDNGKTASNVAYIPQQNTLLPWLSIENNILEPIRLRGEEIRPQYIDRLELALHETGLSEYRRNFPYQCSGGMLQRVVFARQLLSDTKIWLLDEPFTSLDHMARGELQKLLLRLVKAEGLSILLVTHDISEALVLADRIVVMPKSARGSLHTISINEKPRPETAEFISYSRQLRRQLSELQ